MINISKNREWLATITVGYVVELRAVECSISWGCQHTHFRNLPWNLLLDGKDANMSPWVVYPPWCWVRQWSQWLVHPHSPAGAAFRTLLSIHVTPSHGPDFRTHWLWDRLQTTKVAGGKPRVAWGNAGKPSQEQLVTLKLKHLHHLGCIMFRIGKPGLWRLSLEG